MSRSPNFYFGTVIFFLGLLLTAVAVTYLVRFQLPPPLVLIFGLVLMIIGLVVARMIGTRGLAVKKNPVISLA